MHAIFLSQCLNLKPKFHSCHCRGFWGNSFVLMYVLIFFQIIKEVLTQNVIEAWVIPVISLWYLFVVLNSLSISLNSIFKLQLLPNGLFFVSLWLLHMCYFVCCFRIHCIGTTDCIAVCCVYGHDVCLICQRYDKAGEYEALFDILPLFSDLDLLISFKYIIAYFVFALFSKQ